MNHISKESQGTLIVEGVENIGGHYSKTLRLWKEAFLENFDSKIKPALKTEHAGMTDEAIAVFKNKWEVRESPPKFPFRYPDERTQPRSVSASLN